jgi:sulfide:quinone oxidoreductase
MPLHILIVGGGVGGTIVANLLARSLTRQEAEITLIDSTGKHAYMPAWLYLPFNQLHAQSDQLVRPERDLLNSHVHLVTGEVYKINQENRELHVRTPMGLEEIAGTGGASEAIYPYDYLVLATGARLVPSDLPGLTETAGKWHHFYSPEGSLQLREALHTFERGRIVIAVGGIPYRCPPAPLEFTFLLDEWLRKRGLRNRTEIHYLYPLPRVFPIETVAEVVTPLLEERNIQSTIFFNAEAVDTKREIISSLEGEEIPYDLLVLVPPHRGAKVIEESGLGDEQGWLPTDRNTLQVTGKSHIYALGEEAQEWHTHNDSLVQAENDHKRSQRNEHEFRGDRDIPRDYKQSDDDDDGYMQDVKG